MIGHPSYRIFNPYKRPFLIKKRKKMIAKTIVQCLLFIVFAFISLQVHSIDNSLKLKTRSNFRPVISKDSLTLRFIDKTETKNLSGIQVQLRDAKGVAIRQGITNKNGFITFTNLSNNQTYFVLYSGLGFKNNTPIPIKTSNVIQMIPLEIFNDQLDEVVVKAKEKRFTVRGDTTSYNADRYKSRTDENAGNIIEKLPGVQLKDGDLTIDGDKVNTVLLDGKTYIKANTSAALNQIPSEIISRIEIVDNVSPDNAALQLKTVNIVTKSKKLLTFGKLVSNYGSDDRYRAAGNYYFKTDNNRLTVVADANNINKEDLLAPELSELFEGTNSLLAGGLNYQYESDSKNTTFGINIISNGLKRNQSEFFNQYLLGAIDEGPILNTTSMQSKNEDIFSYDLLFTHNFGSNLAFSLTSVGNDMSSLIRDSYSDQRFLNSVNIYNLNSLTNSDQQQNYSNNTLRISKTFNRNIDKLVKSREITLVGNYTKRTEDNIDSLSYNYSDNPAANLWQLRNASTPIKMTSGQLEITENWKNNYQFKYGVSAERSTSKNAILTYTFDNPQFLNGQIETPLSSINEINQSNSKASVKLSRNKGKTQTSIGLNYNILQIDSDISFPLRENKASRFPFLLPAVSFAFNNKNQTRFKIAYNAIQRAPLFRQLNPVLNNLIPSRPLLGQPNLKPEIQHAFDLEFKFRAVKIQHLLRFNATRVDHFIGESIFLPTVDSIVNGFTIKQGTQLIQPLNFDRRKSLSISANHERNKEKIRYGLNYGYRRDEFPNIQNNILAETKINRFNSGLFCNYYPNDVLSVNFFFFSSLGQIQNSINPQNEQAVFNWNSNLNVRYLLFNSLLLNLDATSFQVKTNSLPTANNSITSIVNFSAKHTLFKKQNFSLLFQAHDLLNQNKDIVQNPTALYLTQEQKMMLGRYFLLGLSFNF